VLCAPALARAFYPSGGVCTGRRMSIQRIVPGATPRACPKRFSPGPRSERDGVGIGRRVAVPQSVSARACIHVHE
jgi:hypothetical protein